MVFVSMFSPPAPLFRHSIQDGKRVNYVLIRVLNFRKKPGADFTR